MAVLTYHCNATILQAYCVPWTSYTQIGCRSPYNTGIVIALGAIGMATPSAKSKLTYPPRTVYIEDDLWEWLQKHGEQVGREEQGEPIKTAQIVRRILREHRD